MGLGTGNDISLQPHQRIYDDGFSLGRERSSMNGSKQGSLYLPIFLASVFLFACGDVPDWAGSVEAKNGVPIISNPAVPLLAEPQPAVSALWRIQDPTWVDPSHVEVESGTVTVVDQPANRIHLVSSSGESLASVGQPGGGPGEFLRLLAAFREGDTLVAIDAGKGSVEYLDLEGDYISSFHLDGQPWDGFPLDDGAFLVKGEFLSDPTEESFGDWVKIGPGHRPLAFTSLTLEALPEEEGVQCSDLSPWPGGAARLRFTTPHVQVFDLSGDLLMESRIDLPIEVVSDAEKQAALAELVGDLEARGLPAPFIEQNLIVMDQRWRVKCRFGPLRFDPSQRIAAFLEQNPDDFGSGPATLHFLTETGVYIAKASFPTAWRDFVMEDGVVYALTREPATDLITLEAFRVDFPESVLQDASRVLEAAQSPG
jgi:hypothetical protein